VHEVTPALVVQTPDAAWATPTGTPNANVHPATAMVSNRDRENVRGTLPSSRSMMMPFLLILGRIRRTLARAYGAKLASRTLRWSDQPGARR
jgi:hypothetical protein